MVPFGYDYYCDRDRGVAKVLCKCKWQSGQEHFNKPVDLAYEFASEAPGPAGYWQKTALMLNDPPPAIIFDDMLVISSD